MTVTALEGEKPVLSKEWEKISPKFGDLLVVAIIAGLLSITIISCSNVYDYSSSIGEN